MDYLEIMDFCGYDLRRADELAEDYLRRREEESRRGVCILELKPDGKACRRLLRTCRSESTGR